MRLAAVVLAAGKATRFGGDKLSASLDGEPLLHHAIRAARAAPVKRVIVVTMKGLDIGQWPGTPMVTRVEIASDALSTSLKAGVEAAGDVDGLFVFLGDMPRVPHPVAGRLAKALGDDYAAVPICNGKFGHPVLLSARSFADLAGLAGDAGAGRLLKARADFAHVECGDPGILLDVDRPEDLVGI
ncbi:MAG: nucleotidyltransferase family protein [Alphaproteobacteria bacterium]|nr:nucleotidyltransferase family protein [Alphaproteobacteria bacterium]